MSIFGPWSPFLANNVGVIDPNQLLAPETSVSAIQPSQVDIPLQHQRSRVATEQRRNSAALPVEYSFRYSWVSRTFSSGSSAIGCPFCNLSLDTENFESGRLSHEDIRAVSTNLECRSHRDPFLHRQLDTDPSGHIDTVTHWSASSRACRAGWCRSPGVTCGGRDNGNSGGQGHHQA